MKISNFQKNRKNVNQHAINVRSVTKTLIEESFNGITVRFAEDKSCAKGSASFDEDIIEIGTFEWNHKSELDSCLVLTATLVTLFHEREHILQNHDVFDPNVEIDDKMILSHLVDSNNESYYLLNYGFNVREIDAESEGVKMAHLYMVNYLNIDENTAFNMICDYIEFKQKYSNLYDYIPYEDAKNIEDLSNMFDKSYEIIQQKYNTYKDEYTLPEREVVKTGLLKKEVIDTEVIVKNSDPAMLYMNEQPAVKHFFGNVTNINDRNKIMAAITLEINPELRDKYKNHKCLQDLKLDYVCNQIDSDEYKKIVKRYKQFVVKPVEVNSRGNEFDDIAMNNDHDRSKDNLGIT